MAVRPTRRAWPGRHPLRPTAARAACLGARPRAPDRPRPWGAPSVGVRLSGRLPSGTRAGSTVVREPGPEGPEGPCPCQPRANSAPRTDPVITPTDLRPPTDRRPQRPPIDRRRLGWVLLTLGLGLVVLLATSPSGYLIEQPGPVYDTLGDQAPGGGALVSIDGAKTYPTDGTLDLTTATVVGSPNGTPDLLRVALAWFDPTKSVTPLEAVFPPGVTSKQRDDQSRLQMQNSQQEAIAAALTKLGYDIPRTLTVDSVVKRTPADGVLKVGDEVVSVGGADVVNLTQLRDAISANGTK